MTSFWSNPLRWRLERLEDAIEVDHAGIVAAERYEKAIYAGKRCYIDTWTETLVDRSVRDRDVQETKRSARAAITADRYEHEISEQSERRHVSARRTVRRDSGWSL